MTQIDIACCTSFRMGSTWCSSMWTLFRLVVPNFWSHLPWGSLSLATIGWCKLNKSLPIHWFRHSAPETILLILLHQCKQFRWSRRQRFCCLVHGSQTWLYIDKSKSSQWSWLAAAWARHGYIEAQHLGLWVLALLTCYRHADMYCQQMYWCLARSASRCASTCLAVLHEIFHLKATFEALQDCSTVIRVQWHVITEDLGPLLNLTWQLRMSSGLSIGCTSQSVPTHNRLYNVLCSRTSRNWNCSAWLFPSSFKRLVYQQYISYAGLPLSHWDFESLQLVKWRLTVLLDAGNQQRLYNWCRWNAVA